LSPLWLRCNHRLQMAGIWEVSHTKAATSRRTPKKAVASSKCLRRFQNLFRPGPHPQILSQIYPAHRARRIDEKLGRPGDILAIDSLPCVNQIVTANGFRFRIRKKSECVAGFLTEVAGLLGSVHADRNRTNPYFFKLIKTILDAPQLGVA